MGVYTDRPFCVCMLCRYVQLEECSLRCQSSLSTLFETKSHSLPCTPVWSTSPLISASLKECGLQRHAVMPSLGIQIHTLFLALQLLHLLSQRLSLVIFLVF